MRLSTVPEILGGPGKTDPVKWITKNGHIVVARSDAGIGYKGDTNEDRIAVNPDGESFMVIDAMGGQGTGEPAAIIMGEEFLDLQGDIPGTLQAAHRKFNTLPPGSGVCVAGMQCAEPQRGRVKVERHQAGDVMDIIARSRKWWQKLFQLSQTYQASEPQTIAQRLAKIGIIRKKDVRNHPKHSVVSNYIDEYKFEPTSSSHIVLPGDRALLYSDGIGDNITPEEMIKLNMRLSLEELLEKVWQITTYRMEHFDALHEEKPKGNHSDGLSSRPKRDNRSWMGIEFRQKA